MTLPDWIKQAIAEAQARADAIPEARRKIILDKYRPSPRASQAHGHNWLFPSE